MNLEEENRKKEGFRILLFIIIVIVTQGIREILNEIVGMSIFNYQLVSIALVFYLIIREHTINKVNSIIIFSITVINIFCFIFGKYNSTILLRGFITFVLPLYVFILNYEDIDIGFILKKSLQWFNLIIYVSFLYSIFKIIIDHSAISNRLSGMLGHSLTAAWYYVIFISLNSIFCKYFISKKDIYIVKDIIIALIGITLATGRIAIFIGMVLSILYVFSCVKSKTIKYILIPALIIGFMLTPMFENLIWAKFRFALGYGDITNGRLLGIRMMKVWDVYPNILMGKGIGYSNYISVYLFNTINFENPILMFLFDYGCISTMLLLILMFVIPIAGIIKNGNIFMLINFLCITIIPYTYNGMAESTGLFMVYVFIAYFYIMIMNNLENHHKL